MDDEPYAIVVLGAAVDGDRPRPTLRARLDAAHAAFVAGRASRLIVTGRGEAGPMQRYLLARGVPEAAIVLEPHARTTLHNAIEVARLVPPRARVLLVTQPFHLPRARALFEARGLVVEALPAEEGFNPYLAVRERVAFRIMRLLRLV